MATSTPIGQNWQDIGTGLPQPKPSLKIPYLPGISGVAIDPCIWSSSNGCGSNHEAWVAIEGNGFGAVYHTNDYTQSPVSWGSLSPKRSSVQRHIEQESTRAEQRVAWVFTARQAPVESSKRRIRDV
jgi:hypothetical protein